MMRSRIAHIALSASLLLIGIAGSANNITTSNGSLVSNTGTQVVVEFDVSWENSWRIAPDRWDAAWLFVKYRTTNGLWHHAQLSNTGNVAPGCTVTPGLIDPAAPYDAVNNYAVGAFLYRSTPGTGTFSVADVNLIWAYGNAGVNMGDVDQIRVFAIEMVYVPQGPFYLGSGGTEFGSFTDGSWSSGASIPFQVTSEGIITMGTGANNLWGTDNVANTIGGPGELPAAFPKGFGAFYCMKYEVSQQGFVDFLNTLTYTQQMSHTTVAPNSATGTAALSGVARNGIRIQTPGVASTTPAVYTCNLNGGGAEGKDLACNSLSWQSNAAYLDWTALRPMTEMEYEKACRGHAYPVPDEYPWGGVEIASSSYTLANSGTNNESIVTNYSLTDGNANYSGTSGAINGPCRVGIFAANGGNSSRTTAGGSYYGIMELAGNVDEITIDVRHYRDFTGKHGNGELSTGGSFDVLDWPGGNMQSGALRRGGSWMQLNALLRTSSRVFSVNGSGDSGSGGRGVRTAL